MTMSVLDVESRLAPTAGWAKRLIIEPLFRAPSANGRGASVDFHLGNRFAIPRRTRANRHDPLSHTREIDVVTREFFVRTGRTFSLHPGQFVLGTTLEWFRFPDDMMAYVVGRSIWGRRGLIIVTATAVQPGSAGTITLELKNVGEVTIVLKPGESVGQLFFDTVGVGTDVGAVPPHAGTFGSADYRPVLGDYQASPVEKFLLSLDDSDEQADAQ